MYSAEEGTANWKRLKLEISKFIKISFKHFFQKISMKKNLFFFNLLLKGSIFFKISTKFSEKVLTSFTKSILLFLTSCPANFSENANVTYIGPIYESEAESSKSQQSVQTTSLTITSSTTLKSSSDGLYMYSKCGCANTPCV